MPHKITVQIVKKKNKTFLSLMILHVGQVTPIAGHCTPQYWMVAFVDANKPLQTITTQVTYTSCT